MTTRRSLKPDQPLLVGRLRILDEFRTSTPPHLGLDVWCPYCKREHNHGWVRPEKITVAGVEHRGAHCSDDSPFRDGGYWIALDPLAKAENKATHARFLLLLANWNKRHPEKEIVHV
jgi:hypothetical protein